MGTESSPEGSGITLWQRVRQDRLLLGVVIAAAVLLAALLAVSVLAAANFQAANAARSETAKAEATIRELEDDVDQAEAQAATYKPWYDKSNDLAATEIQLDRRETELTERETAADQQEADVVARERAVQSREDAANAKAGDWWVDEVRECLERPGSYRMASVTEGTLGPDTSCLSG